jgi:hypothetical protein
MTARMIADTCGWIARNLPLPKPTVSSLPALTSQFIRVLANH